MIYYRTCLSGGQDYYGLAAQKLEYSSEHSKHNLVYAVNKQITRKLEKGDYSIFVTYICDGEAEILLSARYEFVAAGKTEQLIKRAIGCVWDEAPLAGAEEIPVREFSGKIESACMDGNLGFSYRLISRTFGWDYFDNAMFKVKEEVGTFACRSREEILKRAGEMLADRSLLEEIDRIYDGNNPALFAGHPVHYKINGGRDACRRVAGLLVEALYSRGRIFSKRINEITEIESGCYDERDAEEVVKNAIGGTVVVEMSGGGENENRLASAYHRVVEYISKLVHGYSDRVLFIFIENPGKPGFAKKLIAGVAEYIDIVDICDGRGNREQAKSYFEKIRRESAFGDYAEPETCDLFPEDREYTLSEIHKKFDKWRIGYLRKFVYKSYSQCSIVASEKRICGEAYEELDDLVGLEEVKAITKRIIASAVVDRQRRKEGCDFRSMSRHMMFTGNPGSCKTTVARILARTLKEEGVLESGELVECGRADLTGKYVGWTDKLVREKFREARGGVLFIDEAYSLVEEGGYYGDEAINTIVQEMENFRDEVIVIFAGYPDKMKGFLDKNEGLRSRVTFHIDFPDYNADELEHIFLKMLGEKNYSADPQAMARAREHFELAVTRPEFGNGRFARNLFEQAVMKQSLRLFEAYRDREIPREALFLLTAEDLEVESTLGGRKKTGIGFVAG